MSVKTGLASQVLEKFEITRFHGEKVLVATIARMMLKATLRTMEDWEHLECTEKNSASLKF